MKKAYSSHDPIFDSGGIGFFESAGQAKAFFANEFDMDFKDVRVRREKWADQYGHEAPALFCGMLLGKKRYVTGGRNFFEKFLRG